MLKRLKEEVNSGRRFHQRGDPAKGIEYNKINTDYRICMGLWSVDIARTPMVIKDINYRVDF